MWDEFCKSGSVQDAFKKIRSNRCDGRIPGVSFCQDCFVEVDQSFEKNGEYQQYFMTDFLVNCSFPVTLGSIRAAYKRVDLETKEEMWIEMDSTKLGSRSRYYSYSWKNVSAELFSSLIICIFKKLKFNFCILPFSLGSFC